MEKIKNLLRVALFGVVVALLASQVGYAQQTTPTPAPTPVTDNDIGPVPTLVPVGKIVRPHPHFPSACHPKFVQHWDKIIFEFHDEALAKSMKIRPHSALDIKVLDNPREVADLKQKVALFLLQRMGPLPTTGLREKVEQLIPHIEIKDVDYAIVCAPPFFPRPLPPG